MPKCHKFYHNCQWTVTHCWPNLTLDTVLLTKVYWSYSKHIVCVCFTPLLKPTLKRDLKRKNIVQINFISPVMASLYELLGYYSLEHSDPNYGQNSYNYSFCSTFTLLFSSIFNRFTRSRRWHFQLSLNFLRCTLINFGMCNPNTTTYLPRRGLVQS